MAEQETQLQDTIGRVKSAAAGAAERVSALVEKLNQKNDETDGIDLSDEIAELGQVAEALDALGATPAEAQSEATAEPVAE